MRVRPGAAGRCGSGGRRASRRCAGLSSRARWSGWPSSPWTRFRSRQAPGPGMATRWWGAWAWSSSSVQFAQALVLAAHEQGEVRNVGCGQLGAGLAHEIRSDDAPVLEEALPHRQTDARLLLVARQRQVGVEQVVRALT